ncbi:A1S_2505 family phage non-structural protein [Pseudoxanthomonas kaohsiungensis]|uniref:A1S_2505 family phage non-structural protein n=1 Tax=Pseudoxanthomonas kaohsiungensis TaxID=283923 RepID=UPI003CCD9562|nr:hypothetical protein CSC66_09170 [Pseudoxanthomonas kaohsiungensis]
MEDRVFVFGSNRLGIHGAGAALFAQRHRGALRGRGEGHHGQSYALPTKDTPWASLQLEEVARHVATFIAYARAHPELRFQVTPVGCGLAGFSPEQVAPLFVEAPENCDLPDEFLRVLAPCPGP